MTAGVSMRMFMLMHLVRPFSCRVHQRPENQSDDSRNRHDNRFWDFITPQYREAGKTDRRRGQVGDRAHAEHDDRAGDGAGRRRRRAVDEGFELRIVAVGRSVIARMPSTMTAPVMAPVAAAVAPSTKALSCGLLRWRLNQGAGTMVKK